MENKKNEGKLGKSIAFIIGALLAFGAFWYFTNVMPKLSSGEEAIGPPETGGGGGGGGFSGGGGIMSPTGEILHGARHQPGQINVPTGVVGYVIRNNPNIAPRVFGFGLGTGGLGTANIETRTNFSGSAAQAPTTNTTNTSNTSNNIATGNTSGNSTGNTSTSTSSGAGGAGTFSGATPAKRTPGMHVNKVLNTASPQYSADCGKYHRDCGCQYL